MFCVSRGGPDSIRALMRQSRGRQKEEYPRRGGDGSPRKEHRHPRGGESPGEVVFGVEPVRELLRAAPGMIRSLHVRTGDERRFASEMDEVGSSGGRVVRCDERELGRLAGPGARHQGILALVHEYRYVALEDALEDGPDPLLLVDGVTDPRNLGAILRSAECAGLSTVVLARDRTVGITPAAIKSSAGAWIHLKIARCSNVARTLEQLKEAGYWIAALSPDGGVSLYEVDVNRKLAIVVGSEGKGVREIVKKTVDFVVDIPMRGKVGSLNVSVATAVALFEIARRRGTAGQG